MTDINTTGLLVQKPATNNDGYGGGIHIQRDASLAEGGTHGHVNTALMCRTIAGPELTQFEWNGLFILDNYASGGENCAFYAQANRHGQGHTFAGVFEACDTNPGGKDASLRGLEVDVWCSGPDEGNRIGVDICAGDARRFRSMEPSAVSVGTAALRISSDNGDPRTVGSAWTKGIDVTGVVKDACIDTSHAKCGAALRIGLGQSILVGSVPIPGWALLGGLAVSLAASLGSLAMVLL